MLGYALCIILGTENKSGIPICNIWRVLASRPFRCLVSWEKVKITEVQIWP